MAVTVVVGQNIPGGDVESGQKFNSIKGTLTFSGSYTTGGESISFASLVPGLSKAAPAYVWISGINGPTYCWVKSTNKLKIYTSGSTEHGAVAYSGTAVNGDVVSFEAQYPKF